MRSQGGVQGFPSALGHTPFDDVVTGLEKRRDSHQRWPDVVCLVVQTRGGDPVARTATRDEAIAHAREAAAGYLQFAAQENLPIAPTGSNSWVSIRVP